MYTVSIDITENESLKALLTQSLQTYVEYKSDGEPVDEDRLVKIRKEILAYLKKLINVNIDATVTYSVNNDAMDVGAIISFGLK